MGLFFTPERELPQGVGFSPLGREHWIVLGLLAVWSAVVVVLGCRKAPKRRQRLLKGMSLGMLGLELVKDGILAVLGAFTVGYLPLHLCSMAMLICIYAAWHPDSDTAGQLLWSLCFSGGLAALLFPDWTDMPLWHFQSVHSFLYHAMLVQFSLITVLTGQARPRVGKAWKVGVFLLAVAVPVYGINLALGTNYMFLLAPAAGSPLELCARLPGRWGYLAGYAVLVGIVLLFLNLPFTLWARIQRRKRPMM